MRIPLLIFFVFSIILLFGQEKADPDPKRFQNEIDAFQNWDSKNAVPENPILFIGSSSIRMWRTHDAFPDLPVINRGFGGAEISDMLYYYDQIAKPYDPEIIVFYCGDNDISAGKKAEQVFHDFKTIREKLISDFPDANFIYLTAKLCQSRWNTSPEIKIYNNLVSEYCHSNDRTNYLDTATPLLKKDGTPDNSLFLPDLLHLNDKGYAIWSKLLEMLLVEFYKD
jgi:lysophospholipase L1-like esterase